MKHQFGLADLRFWFVRTFVWRIRKPRFITLLGGPGAGKGTVATQLAPRLGLSHISTGALMRHEVAIGSDIGKQVQELIEKGALAPDQLVMQILTRALMLPANQRGVILDGFPRTLAQAQMLDQLLASWGVALEKAVWLELSESDLIERLSLRRTCTNQKCGRTYHLTFEPPHVSGTCDACQSPLYQRKDDTAQAILFRLKTYKIESAPLSIYYSAGTTPGVFALIVPTNAMTKEEVLALVVSALAK